jgi:FkbM family methyltransferase
LSQAGDGSGRVNLSWIVDWLPRGLRRHRLVRGLLWLSPGSRVQLVRFNGVARLYADLTDGFPRAYFLSGSYDPEFFDIAAPFLTDGGAVLDVGANVGFCTFGLASAVASPRVGYHLFEAQRALCELMGRSAALYPGRSIVVNHACVSDRPGESRFRTVADHLGASHVDAGGGERVPNLVLDDYLRERRIARVAFVKLDVEGSEPLALRGARASLASGAIDVVYFELSEATLARAGFGPAACLDELAAAAFEVFFIRAADVDRAVAQGAPVRWLDVHGHRRRVVRVGEFPAGAQTDLLALGPSARARFLAP